MQTFILKSSINELHCHKATKHTCIPCQVLPKLPLIKQCTYANAVASTKVRDVSFANFWASPLAGEISDPFPVGNCIRKRGVSKL